MYSSASETQIPFAIAAPMMVLMILCFGVEFYVVCILYTFSHFS